MNSAPHDHQHRAFLRRAVFPNLYTSTLHPEFIPALIVAHLMTPRLWTWAAQSVAGVDVGNTTVALQAVHRFLNKKFYHATGQEFAAIWGLQETRHVTDPEERAASEYAMQVIEQSMTAPWALALKPLLADGLFPLYVYGTPDVLHVHGRRLGKRALGVTSCLDECVLAAALAIAAGVCRWDDVVIVGSPLHYTVYIRTSEGGVWLNAKREIFTKAEWDARIAGLAEADRAAQLKDMVVYADRLICGQGLAVFPKDHLSGDRAAVLRAVAEVEEFAQAKLDFLSPQPTGAGDQGFQGCETLAAASVNSAEAMEALALDRARQGGAPILEAALYMFRHPGFCQTDLIHEVAHTNYYTFLQSASAGTPDDIIAMLEAISGRESLYGTTGRLALPDEVLAAGTASEAERELLHRVLHAHLRARE